MKICEFQFTGGEIRHFWGVIVFIACIFRFSHPASINGKGARGASTLICRCCVDFIVLLIYMMHKRPPLWCIVIIIMIHIVHAKAFFTEGEHGTVYPGHYDKLILYFLMCNDTYCPLQYWCWWENFGNINIQIKVLLSGMNAVLESVLKQCNIFKEWIWLDWL